MPDHVKKKLNFPCLTGKWQYIYSTDQVEISLVELYGHDFTDPYNYNTPMWEIYQIKGKKSLFESVERYPTKAKAEERIKALLNGQNSQL